MTSRSWMKTGAIAAGCAVVGAVAGIAGTAAAPSKKTSPPAAQNRMHAGPLRGPWAGPPVHTEAVVPKRSGSGFETVTGDMGKLKSLSGNDLTITEGTRTEKYKDVTITIPSGAKIVRNGRTASLDALKEGDFVRVLQSPEGTFVMARDPSFRPRFREPRFRGMHPRFRGMHPGFRGMHPRSRGGFGGPPPGRPGGPPPPPPYGP